MKHIDYMDWLKENDPMLYYDLTSDPTGVGDSDNGGCIIFTVVFVIAVLYGFYFFFAGK